VKRLIADESHRREHARRTPLRALLDKPITPLSWMPIAGYGALLDLLAKTEGGLDRARVSAQARQGRGPSDCSRAPT
jgi:hypothetical protein